jgi:hypothetical protein
LGILVSSLGFFNVIPGLWAYFLRITLAIFTIGTIVIGFEIVAFASGTVTTTTKVSASEIVHTSDDDSDE